MDKLRSLLGWCAGVILIGATLCVYFLADFSKTAVTGWALGTVLFAEAMLLGGVAALRRLPGAFHPLLARAGISTVLGLYFIATVVCACLSGMFGRHVNRFVLVSVLLFAAAALAAVLLLYFSIRVAAVDRHAGSDSTMEPIGTALNRLTADFGGTPYGDRLRALSEAARLAGQPGVHRPADEVRTRMAELEQALGRADTPPSDIERSMEQLQKLLTRPDAGRRGEF